MFDILKSSHVYPFNPNGRSPHFLFFFAPEHFMATIFYRIIMQHNVAFSNY